MVRRHHQGVDDEKKTRIVLDGHSGKDSIAELCRCEPALAFTTEVIVE